MATTDGDTIEIPKGDDYIDELVFTLDGDVLDITGYQISFVAKDKDDVLDASTAPVIEKTFSGFDSPEEGIAVISLDSDETDISVGKYVYSIRVKDADDDLITVITGELLILPIPSDGSEFS